MSDVTRILNSMEFGDPKAAEELLPLVYEELRRLAAAKMARQQPGQTLQATALVHEAFLRLAGADNLSFANRRHFFRAAAQAMQRILIEVARRKQTARHGGQANQVSLDGVDIPDTTSCEEFLRVQEALENLAWHDPEKAEIVRLKYFVGLTNARVAELMGLPLRTVERHWAYSKAWLSREMEQGGQALESRPLGNSNRDQADRGAGSNST